MIVSTTKTAFGEDTTARGTLMGAGFSNTDVSFVPDAYTNLTETMVFGAAITTNRVAKIIGSHIGNGGNFKLQWAQFSSGGSGTTIKAGSLLRYRRIL